MTERLTGREIECVQLAGQRLRDAEIAARLNISPRTVANHLQRAYGKLGVRDRIRAAQRLVILYPEYAMPIAPETAAVPSGLVSGGADGRPHDEHDAVGPLYAAYLGLGRWRKPPRGPVRLILILASATISIMLLAVLFSIAAVANGLSR